MSRRNRYESGEEMGTLVFVSVMFALMFGLALGATQCDLPARKSQLPEKAVSTEPYLILHGKQDGCRPGKLCLEAKRSTLGGEQ